MKNGKRCGSPFESMDLGNNKRKRACCIEISESNPEGLIHNLQCHHTEDGFTESFDSMRTSAGNVEEYNRHSIEIKHNQLDCLLTSDNHDVKPKYVINEDEIILQKGKYFHLNVDKKEKSSSSRCSKQCLSSELDKHVPALYNMKEITSGEILHVSESDFKLYNTSYFQSKTILSPKKLCEKCSSTNVMDNNGSSTSYSSIYAMSKPNFSNVSQPIVMNAKTKMSEITQTTAKVSIGNTTISVPLLKPVCSTKIVQDSTDMYKNQIKNKPYQLHQQQKQSVSEQDAKQSAFLNIKRGPKMQSPSIVSLSQLQMRPTNSTKIVQATVVSNKLQLQNNSDITTQSAINMSSMKRNKNYTQKVCYPKQVNLINQVALTSKILEEQPKMSHKSNLFTQVECKSTGSSCDNSECKTNFDYQGNVHTYKAQLKTILSTNTNTYSSQCLGLHTSTKEKKQKYMDLEKPIANVQNVECPVSTEDIKKNLNTTGLYKFEKSACITLQKTKNTLKDVQQQRTSPAGMHNMTSIFATSISPIPQRTVSTALAISSTKKGNNLTEVPQTISLMLSKTPFSESANLSSAVHSITSGYPGQSLISRSTTDQQIKNYPKIITLKKNGNDKSNKDTNKSICITPFTSPAQGNTNENSERTEAIESSELQYGQLKENAKLKNMQTTPVPKGDLKILPDQLVCNTISNKGNHEIISSTLHSDKNTSPAIISEKSGSCSAFITSVCESLSEDNTDVPKLSTQQIRSPSKTEESQNILLKQLLKSTSSPIVQGTSSVAISSICNQGLSNRKIINVRAPSLGLVSSLEAQLARPVMPPVPATGVVTIVEESLKKETVNRTIPKQSAQIISIVAEPVKEETEDKIRPKQSTQIISKETSFISNPKLHSSKNALAKFSPRKQEFSSKITNACTIVLNSNTRFPVCSSGSDDSLNSSEGCGGRLSNNQTRVSGAKSVGNGKNSKCDTKMFTKASTPSAENELKARNVDLSKNCSKVMSTIERSAHIKGKSNTYASETFDKGTTTQLPSEGPRSKERETSEGTHFPETIHNPPNSSSFHSEHTSKNYNQSTELASNINRVTDSLKFSCNIRKNQNINEKILTTKQRKKRKREFYKSTNNTSGTNAVEFANCKKRLRKSPKVEDDYDSFMDNLVFQMKKMAPLEILEPFVCNNQGICTMYGFADLNKLVKSSEYENCIIDKFVHEEILQWLNIGDFYEEQPFGNLKKACKKNRLSMQNNFYDQEFLHHNNERENRKFYEFFKTAKCHNENYSESVLPKTSRVEWDTFSQATFPGLVVINNDDGVFVGRQSPVISLVKPMSLKIGSMVSTPSSEDYKDLLGKPLIISKFEEAEVNVTVFLTLSSIDIVPVLRDLANVLNIPPISSYKVLENTTNSGLISQSGAYKDSVKPAYRKYIQDILNGSRKLCRNCGLSAKEMALRISVKDYKNYESSLYGLHNLYEYLYFCDKSCYREFKCQSMRQSPKVKQFKDLANKPEYKRDNKMLIVSNSRNWKKCHFKYFKLDNYTSRIRNVKEVENLDIFFELDIAVEQNLTTVIDTRRCILCNKSGDGILSGTSRLLNLGINKWVHLKCALWSNGVYETISGGLVNLGSALQRGRTQMCIACHQSGATVKCFKSRCDSIYHFLCAKKEQCVFYKNKTFHCRMHSVKSLKDHEMTCFRVQRRVFIERNESRQVATFMQHHDPGVCVRIGSIILLNVGQLSPHQIQAFHNTNFIYPIGFRAIRIYWSMKMPNKRCRYICTIEDVDKGPKFTVRALEKSYIDSEFKDSTPQLAWHHIVKSIVDLKRKQKQLKIFPNFISGDDLFGLTEPLIVQILENLPGAETFIDYHFKYGRNPLLELPVAFHTSGAARTEPQQRQVLGLKKPHTQRTATLTSHRLTNSVVAGEVACPYSKQFVHSKSSQYKKMNQEWRNNVYLARSKIQGLGLYAARDIEKHTMVIEYIGEIIRTEVSEIREKQYEAKNRGIYMFRLDENRIVDATLSGGLARYINHSCNPNCVTEVVDVDRVLRIIIFAKRRIIRGEELSYDYKFDIEDDAHKLPCMCGASNCKKWMN